MSENPSQPAQLLTKGLEEEVYTGTFHGDVVPLAKQISNELEGFSTEPDGRNVEFKTAAYADYEDLMAEVMGKRCMLRRHLTRLGDYTLVPGATLSLAQRGEFMISDPDNPYYQFIQETYGPLVVTASTHLNVGVPDVEDLIRACRVLRLEASMFLAWSAASPFMFGDVTGFHSTRWHVFPEAPEEAPLFRDHGHFVRWVGEQIEIGKMRNRRHLWISVRPNGPESPKDLGWLELRICDRISCPLNLKAMLALLEGRIWQVLEDPDLDPLKEAEQGAWTEMIRKNEAAAARSSLEAKVTDWQTGREVWVRDWMAERVEDLAGVGARHGFDAYLPRVLERLEVGSPAQVWLRRIAKGRSVRSVIQEAILEMAEDDVQVAGQECA